MQNQNTNECNCGCESFPWLFSPCLFNPVNWEFFDEEFPDLVSTPLSQKVKEVELPESTPLPKNLEEVEESKIENKEQEIFIQPCIEMSAPEIQLLPVETPIPDSTAQESELSLPEEWDENTKKFYYLIRPFLTEENYNWQISNGGPRHKLWLDNPEPFFEKLFDIYEPDQLWINQLFRAAGNKAHRDFRVVFDYDHGKQLLDYKPVGVEHTEKIVAELKQAIGAVLCPSDSTNPKVEFEVAYNRSNGGLHIYTNYYIKRRYDFHLENGDFDFSQNTFNITGTEAYSGICKRISELLKSSRYDYKHSFDSNICGLRAPFCGKLLSDKKIVNSSSKYEIPGAHESSIHKYSLFDVNGLHPIEDNLLASIDWDKTRAERPQESKYKKPDLQALADSIPDGYLSQTSTWRTYMRMFKFFDDSNSSTFTESGAEVGACYAAFDSASKRSAGYDAANNLSQWNSASYLCPKKLLRHLAAKVPDLGPLTKPIEICKKYIDKFPDVPTLGIWSGLGSGKTTRICEEIDTMREFEQEMQLCEETIGSVVEARILLISNRISNTYEYMKRLGEKGFIDYLYHGENSGQLPQAKDIPRFVIQVDSLWKIIDAKPYDLVIVDESESVLTQFMSSQIEAPAVCMSAFERIVTSAKKAVFMDGLYGILSDTILSDWRGDYTLIKNTWKYDDLVIEYKSKKQIDTALLKHLQNPAGLTIITSTSRKTVETWCELARESDLKTSEIHGESDDHIKKEVYKDINKYITENGIQVFSYSPSISTGCDITVPIGDVFVISNGAECNYKTITQMIFRARNAERIHIYIQHRDSKAKAEEFTAEYHIGRMAETYKAVHGDKKGLMKLFERFGYRIFDENGKYMAGDSVPAKIYGYTKVYMALTKEYEKYLVMKSLRDRGCRIVQAKDEPENDLATICSVYNHAAFIVKERKLTAIVNAPDMCLEGDLHTVEEKAIIVRRLYKDRYELMGEEITPQVVDLFFNQDAYATYQTWEKKGDQSFADVTERKRYSAQNRLATVADKGQTALITAIITDRSLAQFVVATEMLGEIGIKTFAELRNTCTSTDLLNRLKNYIEINRREIMAVFDHRDRSKTAITAWKPAQVTGLVNKIMSKALGGKFTKTNSRNTYYEWVMDLPWDCKGMPKLMTK